MKKSFTVSTIIIIVAGLIIKIIGFLTRVFISNTVGAKGLGLYQLFYPFYSLVVLTLTSGITVSQSRLISEQVAKKKTHGIKLITNSSFLISFFSASLVGILLFLLSENIAINIFGDQRLILSLKVFSLFIPLISLGGVLKGYFYGIGNITPTAVSSILEQVIRITVVLAFASYALQFGLAYACLVLAIALIAGEIFNLLLLFIYYVKETKTISPPKTKLFNFKKMKNIINISIPVSANRFVMSALTSIEVILIKNALLQSGNDYIQSLEEFGRLTGMVMPMILFPMVFTNAISTTLVPAISESQTLGDTKKRNNRISKALLFSIVSGVIFTAVFLSYPSEIGWGVYRSVRSGELIYTMSICCIFVYLQQTLIGILNGLEKQSILLCNTLAGVAVRIGGIFILVPIYGIEGYIYGYIASSILVSLLSFFYLKKTISLIISFSKWILKPLILGGILLLFSSIFINITKLVFSDPRLIVFVICGMLVSLGYFLMFFFKILEWKDIFFFTLNKKRRP